MAGLKIVNKVSKFRKIVLKKHKNNKFKYRIDHFKDKTKFPKDKKIYINKHI